MGMRTPKLFLLCSLLALGANSLSGASPSIVIEKIERAKSDSGEIVEYIHLGVSGAPAGSLQTPPGEAPPPARVSVLPVAPGAVRDADCENLEAPFLNPKGQGAAAVKLGPAAVKCLVKAWGDPAGYLAPTLLLPPLEYNKRTIGPVSLAIPNDLTLEEDADASVIDASKLVFKVIYRPWQAEGDEALWQKHFLDPTAWCVSSGSVADKCADQLVAYRKALECATSSEPKACWPSVKDYLEKTYAQTFGKEAAARVERDWFPRFQTGKFGCKELPLPMAVSHVSFDDDDGTLTLTFCRANFRAMQSKDDDFRVTWLGESRVSTPPTAVPGGVRPREPKVSRAKVSRTGRPANQVAAFRSLGQFEPRQRPDGIRFSAANPKAPVANELYVEASIRSDRSAFPPDPSPADYQATTIIPPRLSTRQVYGFRLEGTLMQLGDVRPLKDARKWSVHVLPSISALFNSGELAEDPNSISLKIPAEIRRTLADKGCRFEYGEGIAEPGKSCATPKILQYLSFQLPAVLESTKTGTTKNFVFAPRLGFTLRPLDAAGARLQFGAGAGFDTGKRLTEVQFPDEKGKTERPDGIARFAAASSLAIRPAAPPFGRFTLSFEYKFAQLFRNEIHSSPGDFIVQKDNAICASQLNLVTTGGCIIAPTKGMVRNFAKGTRQWVNTQLSFDVTDTLSVIVAFRKGRLEPLWIYTNQVAAGIAFHLDPKRKPKAF